MFSRLVALLPIAALVAVVAAGDNYCSGGSSHCCTKTFDNEQYFHRVGDSSLITAVIDGILDAGLECNAIGALVVGGSGKCTTQTACCQDVEQNGLVNIACLPISAEAL